MSIRQILIATAFVAIAVTVGVSIYQNSLSEPIALPTPRYLFDEFPTDALQQIQRDLELNEQELCVLELTKTDLNEQGIREEALVQSQHNGIFILRYLYRFDLTSTDQRRWQVWTSYELIEDGAGAESPAVEEFAQVPTAEQIALFKARVVKL